MLTLSAMHDHGFHGGPIQVGNSPPGSLLHSSQGLVNQENFKYQSLLPEDQHRHYSAQTVGRYDHLPPHHSDHHAHYSATHQPKDASQTLLYMPPWQYNTNQHHHHEHQQQQQQQQQQQHHQQQQQHTKHEVVNERSHRYNQSLHSQDQKECNRYERQQEAFSKAANTYSNNHHINDIEFEDVDEDDISDLEEEEELRRNFELYRHQVRRPDVTSRLLVFADVISGELKKYFGRTKGQEDSCDVYEDKWATTKSGRELYYADLLRIAQGDTEPASKTVQKTSLSSAASTSSCESSSPSQSPKVDNDNRLDFKGVRDVSIGMGPLTELFDYGLKNGLTEKGKTSSSGRTKSKEAKEELSSKRSKYQQHEGGQRLSNVTPMHERDLPESFWKEPGTLSTQPTCSDTNLNTQPTCSDTNRLETLQQGGVLASSRLPDFSDLVESWQGGVEDLDTPHSRRLDLPMEQGRF